MDQERFDVANKKTGAIIISFSSLKDAELFVAENLIDGLEVVDTEACQKPMNLFLSQGGLTKQ